MCLSKFSNQNSDKHLISSMSELEKKIGNIIARMLFEKIVIGGHVDYSGAGAISAWACTAPRG